MIRSTEQPSGAGVVQFPDLEETQPASFEPKAGNFDDDDDFVYIYYQDSHAGDPELTEFAKTKLQALGFDLPNPCTVKKILALDPEQYQPFAKLIKDFEFEQEKILNSWFGLKFETMPYGMYKEGFYTIDDYHFEEGAIWLTRLDSMYVQHKQEKKAIKALKRTIHADDKTDKEKVDILKKMLPNTEELDLFNLHAKILEVEEKEKEKEKEKEIEPSSMIRP